MIEHGAMVAAFLDAFDKASMGRLMRTHFDINLDTVAGGDRFEQVVDNLIDWARRQGELPRLVLSAYAENPGNPKLRELVLNNHWKENGGTKSRVVIESSEGFTLDNRQLLELITSNARMAATLESIDSRLQRVEQELRLRTPNGDQSGARYTEYLFYLAFAAIFGILVLMGWRGF